MDAEDSVPVPKPTTPIATVGEAFDVMIDASGIVKENATAIVKAAEFLKKMTRAFARVAIPIVVGLLLVVGGLIFQIELRDDRLASIEKTVISLETTQKELNSALSETREASIKAEIAATSAQKALDAAIANSQAATEDSNVAIQRINEIYETCVKRKEC
jgi:hypothetical protein